MPPKNKSIPLCLSLEDRHHLRTKLLTHLTTHPLLSFPLPFIPLKDQRIPLHITHSKSTYIPFSSLLSTVHAAPLKLPLTVQQWQWLRKFCYAGFFFKGASTSGWQELVPRAFLRLSAAERGFVRGELQKANAQARTKMVPQGAMVIAMYFLLKGGFFPPSTSDSTSPQPEEDSESLFLSDHPTPAAVADPIPFTSYTEHRHPYWKACLDAEPWITIWWMSKCVGHVIDVTWIWQTKPAPTPKLSTLKSDLQSDIPEALIKLIDSVYLNLIDHDVKAGNGSGIWGESGVSSGNAAVNVTLTKLFSHSKHKLEEWPVHDSKMEGIWEGRDFWEEVCRFNKEGRKGGASPTSGSARGGGDDGGEESGEESGSSQEGGSDEGGSDENGSEGNDEETEDESD